MLKTVVVILNWNGLNWLKAFLGNVVRFSLDDETMVCVADNNSTDESVKWITVNYPAVKVLRLDKNYGFAGGYNLALSRLEAKYFILLNSDIEVTPGWTGPLISFLEKNPDAASCQPKILSYTERDRFEHAGAAGGFIDKYGYPFCRGRIFNITEKDAGQYDNQIDTFWSSGACMAVRSDAWRKSGGFDADFFAHMEEIDLCWRFNRLGMRVVYIPESVVYHVGGGALPYNSPFKVYLNFRNSLFLLYKNLPEKRLQKVLFIRRLLDGIAAFLFLSNGNLKAFTSVWKAHRDYYKSLELLKEKRKSIRMSAGDGSEDHIMNKSIAFEFYIRRHRTYQSINS